MLAEHPEFACDDASEPLTDITMEPKGKLTDRCGKLGQARVRHTCNA